MLLKNFSKIAYYTFSRLLPSAGAVVLMYHSIGDNEAFFSVRPKEFDWQMSYLQDHFSVIPLDQLIRILDEGGTLPKNTICITFDDGYLDNYEFAFPILKRYALPASIFIISGQIGGVRTTSSGITLPLLSWRHIHEMSAGEMISFYPHSDSHQKLDLLPYQQAHSEILESKTSLEVALGKKMRFFAYPYGRSNSGVRDIVRTLGFTAAFGTVPGRVECLADRFVLCRNSIDSGVTPTMFKGISHRGRYNTT